MEASLKVEPANQIGEPKVTPGRQLGDISGILGLNLLILDESKIISCSAHLSMNFE